VCCVSLHIPLHMQHFGRTPSHYHHTSEESVSHCFFDFFHSLLSLLRGAWNECYIEASRIQRFRTFDFRSLHALQARLTRFLLEPPSPLPAALGVETPLAPLISSLWPRFIAYVARSSKAGRQEALRVGRGSVGRRWMGKERNRETFCMGSGNWRNRRGSLGIRGKARMTRAGCCETGKRSTCGEIASGRPLGHAFEF
jgi:hypothetical protein